MVGAGCGFYVKLIIDSLWKQDPCCKFTDEANQFSEVRSPGKGSQTLLCERNVWEGIKNVDFQALPLKFCSVGLVGIQESALLISL